MSTYTKKLIDMLDLLSKEYQEIELSKPFIKNIIENSSEAEAKAQRVLRSFHGYLKVVIK